MSDGKPTAFPVLMKNDTCSLIQAADDVYQIRFSNRAATSISCAARRGPS